ncbi:hypothetical protein BZA70DRAFT_287345 [Myxozyma melibiosi]|uniref:Uncharacterized protein n=1 Tax=Myxozyma melibiosi TaxID=54550 RepID=A0ABR1FE42_9ASCO
MVSVIVSRVGSGPHAVGTKSGGKRYPFPKHVWAPTGGWWPNPKNWKKNFIGVGASVAVGAIFLRFFGPQIVTPTLPLEVREQMVDSFNKSAREGRIRAGNVQADADKSA